MHVLAIVGLLCYYITMYNHKTSQCMYGKYETSCMLASTCTMNNICVHQLGFQSHAEPSSVPGITADSRFGSEIGSRIHLWYSGCLQRKACTGATCCQQPLDAMHGGIGTSA